MRKRERERQERLETNNLSIEGGRDAGRQRNRREEEGLRIRTTEEVSCWPKRTGEINYNSPAHCNVHYSSPVKAFARSCFFSLFFTHSDRYTSKLLRKDKGMFSQTVMSSNEMKPNADCIPQHWLREIGHSAAASGQLFVPSKGMENRCHIKCPGMGAVYWFICCIFSLQTMLLYYLAKYAVWLHGLAHTVDCGLCACVCVFMLWCVSFLLCVCTHSKFLSSTAIGKVERPA